MSKKSLTFLLFWSSLTILLLGIYLPGLKNGLVFDDNRLVDGAIMDAYGSLLHLKQRMLSYGTFVWLQSIFGEGWRVQRVVNIALHLGVAVGLFKLFQNLLQHTRFPEGFESQGHFLASRDAAVGVGVALFALNPVAVYAVAYLVQRSILMATLFTVWSLYALALGFESGRARWFAVALCGYLCAVLSKEHAVMAAALVVPFYIYLRRPSMPRIAAIAGLSLLLVSIVVAALIRVYGSILGVAFDTTSVIFQQQLEQLRPGIGASIFPLSMLNQAFLFFKYGALWVLPNPQWMSIDLRPPFPLSGTALPQIVGAVAFVGLFVGAWWMLLRRGVVSLVGLCLLMPLLLCLTEFSTVWVQDPFVLYRSYLWAIALPGLVALGLTGIKPKVVYCLGAVVGIAFAAIAFERVLSLEDEVTAWTDAVEKVDLKGPANAVGRWRPYLNRGAANLERSYPDLAYPDFVAADALGELKGSARFNMGVAQQQRKKHAEALAAFASAAKLGKDDFELHYQRGESFYALGRYQEAFADFTDALARPTGLPRAEDRKVQEAIRLRRGEAAIYLTRFDDAIADFTLLAKSQPENARVQGSLGMAQVGKRDTAGAIQTFDAMLKRKPDAQAYYGRALALAIRGDKAASLQDLDRATALDPRNPSVDTLRAQLNGIK